MYQKILAMVFLCRCAYTDLKYRCVYRRTAAAALLFSAAGHLAAGDERTADYVLSVIPGACCFLVSLLTGEELGYGDSLAVTVLGILTGLQRTAEVLLTGLFFASLWAVGLCIFRRAGRKQEIPLMPFLAASYVLCMAGTWE